MFRVFVLNAGGPRKRRAVKLTGESRVFEDGALGEAPGGGRCDCLTYVCCCYLASGYFTKNKQAGTRTAGSVCSAVHWGCSATLHRF